MGRGFESLLGRQRFPDAALAFFKAKAVVTKWAVTDNGPPAKEGSVMRLIRVSSRVPKRWEDALE